MKLIHVAGGTFIMSAVPPHYDKAQPDREFFAAPIDLYWICI